MTKDTVHVKIDITQIVDGQEYRGNINLDGRNFLYHLRFKVPIDKLDELMDAEGIEGVTRQIDLTLQDTNGMSIPTDADTDVLLVPTLQLATEFYNDPQTRSHNDLMKGAMGYFADRLSANVSCGIEGREYDVMKTPQLERLLARQVK